jgi:hypothetical protein
VFVVSFVLTMISALLVVPRAVAFVGHEVVRG